VVPHAVEAAVGACLDSALDEAVRVVDEDLDPHGGRADRRGAVPPMREIATAAGVAVQTVELAFGTKPALLKAVIDVAIAGDDRPIPVLQREQAKAAQATTDVETFLATVGHAVRIVAERVAGLLVVLDQAAGSDPEIAALARELDAQRATTATWIARGITERAPLRGDLSHDHAVDTIWLLMDPVVFRRLTRDRGWSADDFQHWFTSSIQRLLLPPER
jgi:AcrR family transcriptional regulator